ncbi:MAG: hypothetical protein Q8907_07250 [Bacteroidota bacterium]|nr:hypothetical protein [Bacteroidota bacterium]
MNSYLSFSRLLLLMKRKLVENAKGLGILAAVVFGSLMLISLMVAYRHGSMVNMIETYFPLELIVVGFSITSLSFNELNDKGNRCFYLMLPASSLEKLLSVFLLTSIFYVIANVVLYSFFAYITSIIAWSAFGIPVFHFNPFSYEHIQEIGTYFVCQSVFLLGAVMFRRHALLKTALSILLLILFIGFFSALVFKMAFYSELHHGISNFFIFNNSMHMGTYNFKGKFLEFIFRFIMAPFFWVVSYFQLKEKEG